MPSPRPCLDGERVSFPQREGGAREERRSDQIYVLPGDREDAEHLEDEPTRHGAGIAISWQSAASLEEALLAIVNDPVFRFMVFCRGRCASVRSRVSGERGDRADHRLRRHTFGVIRRSFRSDIELSERVVGGLAKGLRSTTERDSGHVLGPANRSFTALVFH